MRFEGTVNKVWRSRGFCNETQVWETYEEVIPETFQDIRSKSQDFRRRPQTQEIRSKSSDHRRRSQDIIDPNMEIEDPKSDYNYDYKIGIIGHGTIGKSSFMYQLSKEPFYERGICFCPVDSRFYKAKINEDVAQLEIFDLSGMLINHYLNLDVIQKMF